MHENTWPRNARTATLQQLKRRRLVQASIVLVAAVATAPAAAQTRHDDKPHGSAKPSQKSSPGHPAPHTSGRHSDMLHPPSSEKNVDKSTSEGAGKSNAGEGGAKPSPSKSSSREPAGSGQK